MADEYIRRTDAMEYLYRAINANPDGNCPDCVHDEHECQYDRCWTLMDFCEKIEYLGYVPAANLVKVVRCQECTMAEDCSDEREMYCSLDHKYRPCDYFCADGKGI